SAELFDPHTLRWTLTAPPNAARGAHSATLLRPLAIDPAHQDRVLVAGGNDAAVYLNSLDSTELFLLGGVVGGPPRPILYRQRKTTALPFTPALSRRVGYGGTREEGGERAWVRATRRPPDRAGRG